MIPSPLVLLSLISTDIDGIAVRIAVCKIRAPSKLMIIFLYINCVISRNGTWRWWLTVIWSLCLSSGHVNGTSNSKHDNDSFCLILLSGSFSLHDARICNRSPPTKFDSARHRATSNRLAFSSYSFNHLFRSRKHARASSPSIYLPSSSAPLPPSYCGLAWVEYEYAATQITYSSHKTGNICSDLWINNV